MNYYKKQRKMGFIYKFISEITLTLFLFNTILPQTSYAQSTLNNLPIPGTMINLSPGFNPPIIKGITLYANNPLQFDFIISKGDEQSLNEKELREEGLKMIKYFLASLTVPNKEAWVNLSPYEKNRIISTSLGQTKMGRDLLSEDYILKQLTASVMYPENEIGKKFWKKIYKEAQEKYGTTDIPVDAFNKVWIVPDKAVVFEHGQSAFVVERHLKVMLEQDYLLMEKESQGRKIKAENRKEVSELATNVIRNVIIPALEKEVNEGKTFANLRQVYNAMILATWYKKNLKESLLAKVYADKNKTRGVDVDDKEVVQKIYRQYLKAFKKGVYNFIKEEFDPTTQQIIPRKYFAGGVVGIDQAQLVTIHDDKAALSRVQTEALPVASDLAVTTKVAEIGIGSKVDFEGWADKAMNAQTLDGARNKIIEIMHPPEGSRSGVMAGIKGRVTEEILSGLIYELKKNHVALDAQRRKKDAGEENQYEKMFEAYQEKIEKFKAHFRDPNNPFLTLITQDVKLIFFDDIYGNSVAMENGASPDLIIAKIDRSSDGKVTVTLIANDFKVHPWAETDGSLIINAKQYDPNYPMPINFQRIISAATGEKPFTAEEFPEDSSIFKRFAHVRIGKAEGKTRSQQIAEYAQAQANNYLYIIKTRLNLLEAEGNVKYEVKKGKVITFEAPEPQTGNSYLDKNGYTVSKDDILYLRSQTLVENMQRNFINSLRLYFEMINKNPSEVDQLFADESSVDPFVTPFLRDYHSKKLWRGPIADAVELAILYASIGRPKIIRDFDERHLLEVLQKIKEMPEVQKAPKTHEAIRDVLLQEYIKAQETKQKPKASTIFIGADVADEKLMGRKITGMLIGQILTLMKDKIETIQRLVDQGDLEFEEGRAVLVGVAKGFVERYSKNNKAQVRRRSADSKPKRPEGDERAWKTFVKERIGEGLWGQIIGVRALGHRVFVSFHVGTDAQAKANWPAEAESFPNPNTTEVHVAKKMSEKNFYWQIDPVGDLYVTVTNIWGESNLEKMRQYFDFTGAQSETIFDYEYDYVGDVKAALESAQKEGASLEWLAIGPQGSVLGKLLDRYSRAVILLKHFRKILGQNSIGPWIQERIANEMNRIIATNPEKLEDIKKFLQSQGIEVTAQTDMAKELANILQKLSYVKLDIDAIDQILKSDTTEEALISHPTYVEQISNIATFFEVYSDLLKEKLEIKVASTFKNVFKAEKLDKILARFDKKNVSTSDVFSISVNAVADGKGGIKKVVTANIAYGDLSGYIAQAAQEMGVKRIIFNGTAGFDVSHPEAVTKKSDLQLAVGDIIVPTTLRDDKDKIIMGVQNEAGETLQSVLNSAGQDFRIVGVDQGRGEVIQDRKAPHSVTLVRSHHGNVSNIFDETAGRMSQFAKKGVGSLEIELSQVAQRFRGILEAAIYISDFIGSEGETFAQGGVEAVSTGAAHLTKKIFSDAVAASIRKNVTASQRDSALDQLWEKHNPKPWSPAEKKEAVTTPAATVESVQTSATGEKIAKAEIKAIFEALGLKPNKETGKVISKAQEAARNFLMGKIDEGALKNELDNLKALVTDIKLLEIMVTIQKRKAELSPMPTAPVATATESTSATAPKVGTKPDEYKEREGVAIEGLILGRLADIVAGTSGLVTLEELETILREPKNFNPEMYDTIRGNERFLAHSFVLGSVDRAMLGDRLRDGLLSSLNVEDSNDYTRKLWLLSFFKDAKTLDALWAQAKGVSKVKLLRPIIKTVGIIGTALKDRNLSASLTS